MTPKAASSEVRLVILNPGHFHAALVQKRMLEGVSPQVHVYAPEGPELRDYLSRIEAFNSRKTDPTKWETIVYASPDYLEALLRDHAGNVLVAAGNNRLKTQYLKAAVDAGFQVLADKPMCIDTQGWQLLRAAFDSAANHDVLLYDIMTERFEITSILQRELMSSPEVFGELSKGSADQPAITKESVHHLSKSVAGKPLRRPPWYFDVSQQGEGIVDVTTHLVDLVMWICFPDEPLDYASQIRLLRARRWATPVTQPEFERVTGLKEFPPYLQNAVQDGVVRCFCNGEMLYVLKGVHVRISVSWNYEAPEGGGDTHESRVCGSKADVLIHQGKAQNYQPELYLEPVEVDNRPWEKALQEFFPSIQTRFPGVELRKQEHHWHLLIPGSYRVGHEAHFSQVTESYLQFLKEGKLPDWEVPNMFAKYYTTTRALELAKSSS
jgi:predicted dehydrogenase